MGLKNFIVMRFTKLGTIKRFIVAIKDTFLPKRQSYSQFNEDKYLWKKLSAYDLKKGIYLDVGANHPTDISNSYLFYRNNLNGIIIEPNCELVLLHKLFRPRDKKLCVGCSDNVTVATLNISPTPILSTFVDEKKEPASKSVMVPLLKLDNVLAAIKTDFIYLLSVDVEGLTCEVLSGATNLLTKTLYVVAEAETPSEIKNVRDLLEVKGFKYDCNIGCNAILINQNEKYFKSFVRS